MVRTIIAVALVATLFLTPSASASPPPADARPPVIAGDYMAIMDDFSWAGCIAGGIMGSAAAFVSAVSGWPMFWFTANGCSLGMLFGQFGGVWMHDMFTGDNAMDRFFDDMMKQIEQAGRPPQLPPPPTSVEIPGAAAER